MIVLPAIALAAFAIEGALGFGATVTIASLGAQVVPLRELLPAFVPLNLALSCWLVARGHRAVAWRVLGRELAPPIACGVALGLVGFRVASGAVLLRVFAAFVVGLALLALVRPTSRELPRRAGLVLLALGGVVHGLFGTGGPLVVYVARRRITEPRAFRATLAVVWLALTPVLGASYAAAGLYRAPVGRLVAVLALALVPGLALGETLHRRLPAARFQTAVWLVLLAAGVALGVHG